MPWLLLCLDGVLKECFNGSLFQICRIPLVWQGRLWAYTMTRLLLPVGQIFLCPKERICGRHPRCGIRKHGCLLVREKSTNGRVWLRLINLPGMVCVFLRRMEWYVLGVIMAKRYMMMSFVWNGTERRSNSPSCLLYPSRVQTVRLR